MRAFHNAKVLLHVRHWIVHTASRGLLKAGYVKSQGCQNTLDWERGVIELGAGLERGSANLR